MNHYDAALYLGRFQPFHKGHESVLRHAFDLAETVVVGFGSTDRERTPQNPFTSRERCAMVTACLPEALSDRLRFIYVPDIGHMERWCESVRDKLRDHVDFGAKVCVTGVRKDASTEYVRYLGFPFEAGPHDLSMAATDVRSRYFLGFEEKHYLGMVPFPVAKWLREFRKHPDYAKLCEDFRATVDPNELVRV